MERVPFSDLIKKYEGLNQRSKRALRKKFNDFFSLSEESEVFTRLMNHRLEVTLDEYDYLAEQIPKMHDFLTWHRSTRNLQTA